MKINLLVEWFAHPNDERYNELKNNLLKNIKSNYFDNIYIFSNSYDSFFAELSFINVEKSKIDSRVTYSVFFNKINTIWEDDNIYIIANLDILFDDSILKLKECNLDNKFLCLTRWNLKGYYGTQNGSILMEDVMQWNPSDSHDVWITKDKIKEELLLNSEYNLGTAGCDGKICLEIQKSGYITENPANEIKTYHQHLTGGYAGHRTYNENTRYGYPYGQVHLKN